MPVGTTYINETNANIEVIGLLFLFLVLLFILIFRSDFFLPNHFIILANLQCITFYLSDIHAILRLLP